MRRLKIPIALSLAALLAAGAAHGELAQSGELRVAFDGRIFPRALPRDRPAPVSVRLAGSVGMADGTRPPQLRGISFAINGQGRLSFRGLPTCSAAELEQTTTEAALSLCRDALVGHGRFAAGVAFPGLAPIPARGRVLAFAAKAGGEPAILLHIYGSSPIRATFVLPFTVSRRRRGDFGTVLQARIPRIASDLGYVTEIDLTIGRRYRYAGRPRSFLSASCAAPAGFAGAVFALVRGTFSFVDGERVTTTLVRHCTVRRRG